MQKIIEYWQLLKKHRRTELLWSTYAIFYMVAFPILEKVVPLTGYWSTYIPLDDYIPFIPEFIFFYGLWFPYVIGTGVYCFFYEPMAFRRFMKFMAISCTTAMLFCLLVPNGQDLRATTFPSNSIFVQLVRFAYSVDTNTNVFPSIHVVCSVQALNAFCDSKSLRKYRFSALILTVLISISTVFVKQHSAIDILGGILWCIPCTVIVYHRRLREYIKSKRRG